MGTSKLHSSSIFLLKNVSFPFSRTEQILFSSFYWLKVKLTHSQVLESCSFTSWFLKDPRYGEFVALPS